MSACGIDPSQKKLWVKVLPELPADFRFRTGEYEPPAVKRGGPPEVAPKFPPAKPGGPPTVFQKTRGWNQSEAVPSPTRTDPEPLFTSTPKSNRGKRAPTQRLFSGEEEEPYGVIASGRGQRPSTGVRDLFTGSENIDALTTCNFDEFIALKEKTFVMFYDPNTSESINPAKELATVAERAHPKNHSFASVDCTSNQELCCRERASPLPIFKLYSYGIDASTIKYAKHIKADQISMLINLAPVLGKGSNCGGR